jgi:hypothetical protein
MTEQNQLTTPSPSPNPVCPHDPDWQHRKKKKKDFAPVGSSYIGKCEDIKMHVYSIRPTRKIDLFAKTTQEICKYLACTIKNGAKFWTAFDPEDLGCETIVEPLEPEDLNNPLMVKW